MWSNNKLKVFPVSHFGAKDMLLFKIISAISLVIKKEIFCYNGYTVMLNFLPGFNKVQSHQTGAVSTTLRHSNHKTITPMFEDAMDTGEKNARTHGGKNKSHRYPCTLNDAEHHGH